MTNFYSFFALFYHFFLGKFSWVYNFGIMPQFPGSHTTYVDESYFIYLYFLKGHLRHFYSFIITNKSAVNLLITHTLHIYVECSGLA